MMAVMKSRRPLLPLAILVVLGELTVASECDFILNLVSGILLAGLLLYFFIIKKVSRSAAALLVLLPALSMLHYTYCAHVYSDFTSRITPFLNRQVRLRGTVSDVTPGTNGLRIYLKDTLLNSAYGDFQAANAMVQAGRADSSILSHYHQPIGTVLVNDPDSTTAPCSPGQIIDVYAIPLLSRPATNPGQFDFYVHQRAQGLSGTFLANRIVIISHDSYPFYSLLSALRSHIITALYNCFPENDAGIYEALLTGQKAGMDENLRELFQKSGISHILAVSGLHLSILGTGFYQLLRKCGATFRLSGFFAGILILSYGILTGCSGSALRAILMLLARFLSPVVGKRYDMLSASAASCIMLLFWSPYLLFTSGFQLSFLAITALALYPELPLPQKGILRIILTSLLLQGLSLPVLLHHFFYFPLYGIFLNFLILPLMGLVFYSGLLAVSAVLLGCLSTGIFFAGGGHYLLKLFIFLSESSLSLPFGSLLLGSPTAPSCIRYYLILFTVLLLGVSRKRYEKRHSLHGRNAHHSHSPHILYFLFSTSSWRPVILTCIILFNVFLLLPKHPKHLEITSVDVGQGDGFVLRKNNTVVTIDLGSTSDKKIGKNVVAPYLLSQGISDIDTAILTHSDQDHISGILYLLTETDTISIGRLVLPAPAESDRRYNKLRTAAEARQVPVQYISAGDTLRFPEDDISLYCVYPLDNAPEKEANLHSIGLFLSHKHFQMLFTGDMDQSCEQNMLGFWETHPLFTSQPVKLDLLKAGHHGSSTSTSEALLDLWSPDYALLSYGIGNDYGHPHEETLEKLTSRNIGILETGTSGAITIVTDGQRYSIQKYVSPRLPHDAPKKEKCT